MAICQYCNQEMSSAASCTIATVLYPDGNALPTIPYAGPRARCHDCNVTIGGTHHPGCDAERCPRCLEEGDGNQQLISCGCLDSEEEGECWEDDDEDD